MVRRLHATYRQGFGKIRRFLQARFRKHYIRHQEQVRKGECVRCGTCCKLLFNCPFLEELPGGASRCRIHQKRPMNCRIFPVNAKDIRDRNTKNPHTPCGYHFE